MALQEASFIRICQYGKENFTLDLPKWPKHLQERESFCMSTKFKFPEIKILKFPEIKILSSLIPSIISLSLRVSLRPIQHQLHICNNRAATKRDEHTLSGNSWSLSGCCFLSLYQSSISSRLERCVKTWVAGRRKNKTLHLSSSSLICKGKGSLKLK